MTLDEFKLSLSQPNPPAKISRHLHALWLDAKGDWNTAHEIVQSMNDAQASWIHAYLHRKEGDLSNAGCWYYCAGKPQPTQSQSLQEEWEVIVGKLLLRW